MTTPGGQTDYHLVVDGRGLEPPEPLHRVLEGLDFLPPGKTMLFLVNCQPKPLLRMLAQNGYSYRCELDPDSFFRVSIWQRQSPPDVKF